MINAAPPPWRVSSDQESRMQRENSYQSDSYRSDTYTTIAAHAYTPVQARKSFARAELTTVQTPQHSPPKKQVRDWPPSVRQYVQRAFAENNIIPGIARSDMEIKLKQVIAEAAESNTILSTDWDTLPLPQELLHSERIQFFKSPVSGASNKLSNLDMHDTNNSSNGHSSKKRKSSDSATFPTIQDRVPPWRTNTNTHNALEDRITYPDKRPRNDFPGTPLSKFQNGLESRKRRFGLDSNGSTSTQTVVEAPSVDQGPLVGRSKTLEKKYFRLTSAPNPDNVRPLHVLEQTLALLKQKWRQESNYSYICDQFKSLRQDLTVQHIWNDFTVNVYETHARIALEKGDLGEYNQCQTVLRGLYKRNLGGHPEEFKAYRILYYIYTCNRTDMNNVLSDLTPAEKNHPSVRHADQARAALAFGNYHRFFRLYLDSLSMTSMTAYLMDMFVSRERLAALASMCKA